MPSEPSPSAICGVVVAFNERDRIVGAVRSLLDQKLPPGTAWSEIVVVASGCTDATETVVTETFEAEPLVRLVVEPVRAGKGAALNTAFDRLRGDWCVLLDGDCRAEPGAIGALLHAAGGGRTVPVAVGARHVPPVLPGALGQAYDLLWTAVDAEASEGRYHDGRGVLLDNLVLLPGQFLPRIPTGLINEADWLRRSTLAAGGTVVYAPDAGVAIDVPPTWGGLVAFRRRVLNGHRQSRGRGGPLPPTISAELRRHPFATLAWLLRIARRRGAGVEALLGMALTEVTARLLSLSDSEERRAALYVWPRLPSSGTPARRSPEG